MTVKPVPMGPLYSAQLKIHMGADKAWAREENKNLFRIVNRRAPEDLWYAVLQETAEMLGLGGDRFIFGLLLNAINGMPDETRAEFLMGIVTGAGMTIKREHDGIEVDVLEGSFNPIAVTPDGQLEQVTKSGLVVVTGAR